MYNFIKIKLYIFQKGVLMSNRIKELRKNNGLTLKELSTATDIPISSISKYENMERDISQVNAEKIASYFHVDVSYLLRQTFADISTIMVNIDDKDMVPFESTNAEAMYSAIAINQVLKWLDSNKMLLYTDKRQKTAYSREYELTLLKEMHIAFENMRDTIQIGMDRQAVPNENDYVHALTTYTSAMKVLRQFISLDADSQKSISQLVNKLEQNKKASDDKPETER